ncbi:MAG: Fic family protein [Candidatus Gastranaerophilales bacterium]|nr:Fic family protein [Candidatus Gastranaerophilales bacterium]
MYQNRFKDNDEYKAKIDSFRPLSEQVLSQLKAYYKIGLTYSSNAIEGNTLTLVETKIIIEDGLTIGGKSVKEHLEVIGHAQAYDLLFKLSTENIITEDDILQLHKLFYKNIDEQKAGVYRDCNVMITGSEFELPKHDKVKSLMQEFCENIPKAKKQYHPVEFAARIHEKFVAIHPFMDGNGRCARLLMNLALLQAGYNIVVIPPIVKNDYIGNLEEAHTTQNVKPFINFISEMVLESQKEYLRIIERLK